MLPFGQAMSNAVISFLEELNYKIKTYPGEKILIICVRGVVFTIPESGYSSYRSGTVGNELRIIAQVVDGKLEMKG